MASEEMTDSQASAAMEEAEAMEKAAGAMPPPISKEPTPDWLNKKNHPALANPLAGAAGRGRSSLPLQPSRKPSAATAAANQLGGMGIASQGEAGTDGTAAGGPLQRSGASEDTLIEGDEDDEIRAAHIKDLRYEAIDVGYTKELRHDAIHFFLDNKTDFVKAGITFFECQNSGGQITVTSLTKALKDSKKSRGIVETSMATTRSRQGHMARAAACVFASNYALHVGTLTFCVVLHLIVAAAEGTMTSIHLGAALVTALMLAGRWYLHHYVAPLRARRFGATGWCLPIIVMYLASMLNPKASQEQSHRAAADPLIGIAVFMLCALAGMLHSSVAPPRAHSLAVLGSVLVAIGMAMLPTRDLSVILYGMLVVTSHVLGYALSTHCFEQQAALVRFKEDKAEVETRNAQLVSEKERLAWEVASHHDGEDPLVVALGASLPPNQPSAQHLVLGVLQPQEVTDAAVSIAASADHATSSGSPVPLHVSDLSHNSYDTPPPGPLFARPLPAVESAPRGDSPGSVRSVSVTSSLRRRTPSLVASSVMDTHSVAAAKDITRAPRMPRDDTMLPRPCLKTRSDPGA